MSEADPTEQEIVGGIAAAGLRLRFDKVAVRVVDDVKAALAGTVREDQAVVFTLTAPIRLPAKTTAAIRALVRDGLPRNDARETIHGNQIHIRRIAGVPAEMPRVMGFVHNRESASDLILALVEARLRGAVS